MITWDDAGNEEDEDKGEEDEKEQENEWEQEPEPEFARSRKSIKWADPANLSKTTDPYNNTQDKY